MKVDGTLSIRNEESRVSGTQTIGDKKSHVDDLLIIKDGDDPTADATDDLEARGFRDGDDIRVKGAKTSRQGEPAIRMNSAQRPIEEGHSDALAAHGRTAVRSLSANRRATNRSHRKTDT
jgi:hypothetical protein